MLKPREVAAEFIGTMFLVIASVASMVMFTEVFGADKPLAVLANAIAVGFTLIALIEIFGSVSGANFNPAVTLAMLLNRKTTGKKAGLYIVTQFAGGMAGVAAANAMFLEEVGAVLALSNNPRTHTLLGEILGTFILILAIFLLVKQGSGKISVIVGLLVGGMLLSTSSTMFANPAVTLARMFTPTQSGIAWADGLLFITMQIIGAALALATFKLIFDPKKGG
ncbi:MAG: aquaporin [Defluviitaleaceae bacterium]|nr:aquaporin [Defluviitaleaceae bacterium]